MRVALTGATGFIGSHILDALRSRGHEVKALVKDDVDLFDSAAVARAFSDADAAIHTASPGDATSADLDAAVADGAIEAFDGTGRPYLHISGIWVYGDNTSISEDSPMKAPAMVAWKSPIESRIVGASGMRGVVIVSSVAYGDGGGALPGLVLGSPRDAAGNLVMAGDGQQQWSTVHVADLADFFVLALEDETARGYYVVGDGVRSTVAEITAAAAEAVGAPGAVPGSATELRSRVGDYFAEVLLLDEATPATKARALGWSPSRPSLVDDLRHGSYRREGT
jgi:nucleoside-diphosphate-sugar epimerase